MRPPRPRNPAIPGTTKDRTGSAGILRRAAAEIRRRFAGLERDILAIFGSIRVYAGNAGGDPLEDDEPSEYQAQPVPRQEQPRTTYGATPGELAAIALALQLALDRWIAGRRDQAAAFWFAAYVAEASQRGTAQSAANLTNLSAAYAAARSLQQAMFSADYINRLAMAQIRSYEHWIGLAAATRAQVFQIIGHAVADGVSPRSVRAQIAEALAASLGRALGYAQADITEAVREARIAEAEAAIALGLNIGLLWASALIPTTRPTHAERHGRSYTGAQVRAFYAVNGNRYNCHCATTECLLGADGAPILTPGLKGLLARERRAWEKGRS